MELDSHFEYIYNYINSMVCNIFNRSLPYYMLHSICVQKKIEKKINTFILAITTIVISLGITFFNIQYLFSYIFEFSKINSLIQEGYFRSGIMLLLVILSVIVATPFINKYLPILTGNYIPRKHTINYEKK